jgi:hypothetical protein
VSAVSHANLILSWQENLLDGEMPPQWMWHLDHELRVWFERIDEKRKERFGGTGGDDSDDEHPDMMTNSLGRRGK